MGETRHATRADLPALCETLASAFADDPMLCWIYDDPAARPEAMRAWMALALDAGLTRGHTYAGDANRAAAIWSPPDATLFDEVWGKRLGEMMSQQLGARAGPVLEALSGTMQHHPEAPHFYLFMLGTHAEHQGRGLGQILIEPILRTCDEQGLVAHLESSNVRNVPFYLRHGFEVVAEVALPDGPVIRPMTRRPRGAAS